MSAGGPVASQQIRYIFGLWCGSMIESSAAAERAKNMISGLERRNSCAKLVIAPKQGDYAASRLRRLVSSRAPTSSAMSILCPWTMFSNACPEARKQCNCEALTCVSCHKQVPLEVRGSPARKFAHSSKYTKSTLPSCRTSPSQPLSRHHWIWGNTCKMLHVCC